MFVLHAMRSSIPPLSLLGRGRPLMRLDAPGLAVLVERQAVTDEGDRIGKVAGESARNGPTALRFATFGLSGPYRRLQSAPRPPSARARSREVVFRSRPRSQAPCTLGPPGSGPAAVGVRVASDSSWVQQILHT